jgi:carbon-monoxide dehydrogenase medium subunit
VQPFELLQPSSLDEALAMLADDPEARPLAGGTAMVILMKHGLLRPERLINLKRAGELRGISQRAGGDLRVGALTSIRDVEYDPFVRGTYPALAEACHVVANIRIRNLATIGGNVAHADYQSDPPAMLTALGARVGIRSTRGEREELLEDFLVSGYQTTLEPDELVTGIIVPARSTGQRTAYVKFTTRSAEDRPCVGVAIRLGLAQGRCDDLRLVIGAVSPAPVRVVEAERIAIGEPLTPALAEEIGNVAAGAVEPVDDIRGSAVYKRRLVGVLVRRTLLGMVEEGSA